jgi:hypothetical protein
MPEQQECAALAPTLFALAGKETGALLHIRSAATSQ